MVPDQVEAVNIVISGSGLLSVLYWVLEWIITSDKIVLYESSIIVYSNNRFDKIPFYVFGIIFRS